MAEQTDSSLQGSTRRLTQGKACLIDYKRCIICQKKATKELFFMQSSSKKGFIECMNARHDDVYKRFHQVAVLDTWIKEFSPKWHNQCRNLYTNKKSCEFAKRKRCQEEVDGTESAEVEPDPEPSSSVEPNRIVTRQTAGSFDPIKACIICNKERDSKGNREVISVSTKNRQENIEKKARLLKREDVLLRLVGKGHDMVASDFAYHKRCMDSFMKLDTSSEKNSNEEASLFVKAFYSLVEELEIPLFQDMAGLMVKAVRDKYRMRLQELGITSKYRSSALKTKLKEHYGQRISILEQQWGSGFICAASLPLGDALEKLRKLEEDQSNDDKNHALWRAVKILKTDCGGSKKQTREKETTEVSTKSAYEMIPDSLFNFTAMMLSNKKPQLNSPGKINFDQSTTEKAIILSQQVLHHVTGIPTPLAIATAFHIYNQTRSKSLITLANRLGVGISYERLQRQLTAHSEKVMEKIETDGVYVPDTMSKDCRDLHVFAMDNLDWKKKTLEGGSFNATTAIIVENQELERDVDGARVPTSTSEKKKALPNVAGPAPQKCYLSASERQKSRSLSHIEKIEDLETPFDGIAEDLLLIWRLGRIVSTSQILDAPLDKDPDLPGFSAFCAHLHPRNQASVIGYLPLIPKSPTDPSVLKEEMKRLVATSVALGDAYTIITGDQATYETATAIRDKCPDEFSNVVLLLGGFHQAHNFLKAICKIMREAGAENLLVAAGHCEEGTAKKIFGEKSEYYQTFHAIKIISEAMWRLLWDSFEVWVEDKETQQWKPQIESFLKDLFEHETLGDLNIEMIKRISPHLKALREQLGEFTESLNERPTAMLWLSFLEMSNILLRFNYYEREACWIGHLHESALMLPYLTAAGHYKYGQQSLPQYLAEMKSLPEKAPEVHASLMNGVFVGRRADGCHNSVSLDLLLEQTYNADAKEASGLDGITLNIAARNKWVYTKPLTAAVSAELKSMLHLHGHSQHHESGQSRVTKDAEMVTRIMAAVEKNPFSASTSSLINISTGQCADSNVKNDLVGVKELGQKALCASLSADQTKTKTVKLNTFFTQSAKPKKQKEKAQAPGKSNEVNALLRLTQIHASGGDMDLHEFIGKHECSKFPPSLFKEDGNLRTGTKANLVKKIKEETNIAALPELPQDDERVSVVIDAMAAIRRWSFEKGETFGSIAERYLHRLLFEIPANTCSIHFCCDRYDPNNLKTAEQEQRYSKSKSTKVYEISAQYTAPDPQEFFAVSENKANFLDFLCQEWSEKERLRLFLGPIQLFLGGGFKQETKSVEITEDSVQDVPELESTQKEADTRVLLHTIFAFKNVERVVIYANDTDVVITCLYYAATQLRNLGELWIRTEQAAYLPIHQMAAALGVPMCRALPFIHSLSGRDTTSFPYFTGKRAWFNASKQLDISELQKYGESNNCFISDKLRSQARALAIEVYTTKDDHQEDFDLGTLRVYKFLNNKSTLLKLLPPTQNAFDLHVKRAALATYIDKHSHIQKPDIPPFVDYGWGLNDSTPVPCSSTAPAWPQSMTQALSCSCVKGCTKKCPCAKKAMPCYMGCRCQGLTTRCSRMAAYHEDSD